MEQQDLWVGKTNGYDTYRIPALAATAGGAVLAFCEGRVDDSSDAGDIDILVKRSTDGGDTWSEQQVIWNDGANTCGNPAPVVDAQTGAITLLLTWNRGDDVERQIIAQTSDDTRRVFAARSEDDGRSWSEPVEITAAVKPPQWTWYATGPGGGIQVEHGPHAGRLVVACDHIESGTDHYYSHIVYSDDGGAQWELGGRSPQHQTNECEVVELTGDRLMLNMRNYDRDQHSRQVALSDDGGITWRDQRFDDALIEPICQASIRRHSWPGPDGPGVILFSNPASVTERANMTVRGSFDEGQSWPLHGVLNPGASAYSDLVILPDDERIGCLYEAGDDAPYERLRWARFELSWLQ